MLAVQDLRGQMGFAAGDGQKGVQRARSERRVLGIKLRTRRGRGVRKKRGPGGELTSMRCTLSTVFPGIARWLRTRSKLNSQRRQALHSAHAQYPRSLRSTLP
jgi:hypothetical protein